MLSQLSLLSFIIPFVLSQSIPTTVTELQLETVDAEYTAQGFDGSDPETAFGLSLDSQALLTVAYTSATLGLDQLGTALTKDDVASLPTIYITPSTEHLTNFTSASTFTITLSDASAVGHPDTEGNFRHYLRNGVTLSSDLSSENQTTTLVLSGDSGNTVTFYAGPGPNAGEGPHRYAWLLFREPQGFTAPSSPSSSEGASHWSLSSYVQSANLGSPVAAAFFTVENGEATYSVAPTSQVNPSTLAAATATGASNEVSIVESASKTATGSSAPSASTTASQESGADGLRASVWAVGVFGLLAMML